MLRVNLANRKFAIYVRCLRKDAHDGERLLRKLRKYCAKRKWHQPEEYVDRQLGNSATPPEFRRLLDDARRRKIDIIVFWGLEQFSREGAAATLTRLHFLSLWSCGWHNAEDELSNFGRNGELVAKLLLTLYQQNSINRMGCEKRQGENHMVSRAGRPSLPIDFEKAKRLREAGAPLWFIHEELGRRTVSESTLSRRLRDVTMKEAQSPSYWEELFKKSRRERDF